MIDNKYYLWKEIEEYVLSNIKEEDYYSNSLSTKPKYSIIMPPPNVTGQLHIGHALVTTLQDTLVRYKRMVGFDVKWQPGLDHAGIATQVIVEKKLQAQNISKYDLGREKFLEEVYKWKEESGGSIVSQIKKLGASCDFSYLAFTMDEHSVHAVNKVFVDLYSQGLIYRDDRLVNWDTSLQTAISDLEVEQKEINGLFYYLKYYIDNSNEYMVIATTRPETLFGDVAVAVNPEDERYKHLVGKMLNVPLINKKIPIIADEYADIEKGSGAVKITPAHDFNDFEVGQRNNLESINILNKDGTLNENVPQAYIGLSIKESRSKILEDLRSADLIEKEEPSLIMTPFGDRSGTVIEPLLTKQWFIDAQTLSKEAIRVFKDKEIEFVPASWSNLYFDWMENIKPWCISRQLWWGHQIPIWYAQDGYNEVFCAANEEDAYKQAREKLGSNVILKRDEDVLDTWFSSSLWPFITMGWPNNDAPNLDAYYPTSVLVTGFDIIFFWVARMVMMGIHFTKKVPFKEVYINALIRDEKGQKMSKSKGNVIDPLTIMDQYGTDTLRFTLISYSAQGRDIKLAEKTIEGNRNFVTKIWNSYKFCSMNNFVYNPNYNPNNVKLDINKWILHKIQVLQSSMDALYTGYKFNDISSSIYKFIWGEFCDWYLELAKSFLYLDTTSEDIKTEIKETMGYIFDGILRIIHPIMPFISQYLYEDLHKTKKNLALEEFPNYDFKIDKDHVEKIDNLVNIISKIRSIKSDYNIPPSSAIELYVNNSQIPDFISNNMETLSKLAKIETIKISDSVNSSHVQFVLGGYNLSVSLKGMIDTDKEIDRLKKLIEKIEKDLKLMQSKLQNDSFISKARSDVIDSFKEQEKDLLLKLDKNTVIYNIIKSL